MCWNTNQSACCARPAALRAIFAALWYVILTRFCGCAQSNAGLYAGCFGLTNFFARSMGGFLSDFSAKYAGMRGRLWTLFITQIIGGAFLIIMGRQENSLGGMRLITSDHSALHNAALPA